MLVSSLKRTAQKPPMFRVLQLIAESKRKESIEMSDCLGLNRAIDIVQECSGGLNDIDKTLEEVGLITDAERLVFREFVFNKELAESCQIMREENLKDGE